MASNGTNGNSEYVEASTTDNITTPNSASIEDAIKPIAVVGFSIRFPEDATTSENFWKMIMERRCVTKDFPLDRINSKAFHHPDTNRLGALQHHGGFFLKGDLGAFDAPFFSMTSKEAAAIDPQQRGILETAYRALENAGLPIEQISGSKTSVHTASFCDDYKTLMSKDPELVPKHAALGVAFSILANRLSWFFNLKGPSVHMDSACSSSLMALDSACQALRNGDSQMALVAAANLIFSPDSLFMLSNMNFLSPDSRCFSFDDRANGYARGEGYSVLVLKSLEDAIKNNDTIRAVIRSTGSNQDGRTPGITQPSKEAQETLIRETYAKAGLDMSITRYVEAHGTGTRVGDPTEASAIGSAFKSYRSLEEPLYIGAVKSNIGHLEGAAGMAGLIKAILALEHGIIPPNVFKQINSKIDIDYLKIKFPAAPITWPSSGLRRASINSFGFGGSNSHVIIDDSYNFLKRRGLAGSHCTVKSPPVLNSPPANTKINKGGSNGSIRAPKLL
ncbi:Reducing polyketide synthase, partial [Lachnellula occidentalis]